MQKTVEEITDELLNLPAKDRAKLAEKLIASLDEDGISPDVEAAWLKEAERRMSEIKAGRVKGRSAEDVIRDARNSLK